jgi:two-component system sensor histidine kinase KdpD
MSLKPTFHRPNPDALVLQLKRDAEMSSRGKLRIYFGANAGVGKTFAMLSAAQREKELGNDVVVGLVETHGRVETAELTNGLEHLPSLQIPYRDRILHEFDLDGALARHPAILLVDELAHSNAPGTRHEKRWQDIQELLEAGIDVWTAMNVQHLESLNGTVGAITGIRVHETVPDSVIDHADELVLIDVSPDELTKRLRAGKVYMPQQAERAAQNFFRKGNLIALREIALRRTAERVSDDRINWRVQTPEEQNKQNSGVGSDALLCCVGPHPGADQTVRAAARLAGSLNQRWSAVYVETPTLQRLAGSERDRILATLKLAEDLGATTAVLTSPNVAQAVAQHSRGDGYATVVLGRSVPDKGLRSVCRKVIGGSLQARLVKLAPELTIMQIGTQSSTRRLSWPLLPDASDEPHHQKQWLGYAWAVATSVVLTTLLQHLGGAFELTNIVMLFMLGVVLIAFRFGRMPAALAAVLNVLAFDFFFVPPLLSFSVTDAQYLVTFAVMLGVGLLIGQLTAGLQFQARVAGSRELRAQSLFELSRSLSAALLPEQIADLGEAAVKRNFGGEAHVIIADDDDKLPALTDLPGSIDPSVADWAYRNGQAAGLATATLSSNEWHYLPLLAPMRIRGVLACRPEHARWLMIPSQHQLLSTLSTQVAIALERVHYVDIARQAIVEMESERMRNTLLAAMSHDIRTPLTALLGQAEMLQRGDGTLPGEQRQELLAGLVTTAQQMQSLVINLLDMAKLQSGLIKLRSDWQSVEEVVGAALAAASATLKGTEVRAELDPDLPLVQFDATMIERVLVNLLENASKYGASPVVVKASVTENELRLTVRDHGSGLPHGAVESLFEMFTRGHVESDKPGVGLGLAICREIVRAHEGHIEASNAHDGGAEFTVRLPRTPPPALDEKSVEG